jgi:CheY-like chemotaxis protein
MSPFLPPSLGSAVQDKASPRALDWRGSGCVLVVDDQDPVRNVVAHSVAHLGFTTSCASNGREALSLFGADPGLYALAILDIKIPVMDGVEIMNRMRLARPDIPVILMSGYNNREVPGTPARLAKTGFLHKPFTLEALASELRAVIGG